MLSGIARDGLHRGLWWNEWSFLRAPLIPAPLSGAVIAFVHCLFVCLLSGFSKSPCDRKGFLPLPVIQGLILKDECDNRLEYQPLFSDIYIYLFQYLGCALNIAIYLFFGCSFCYYLYKQTHWIAWCMKCAIQVIFILATLHPSPNIEIFITLGTSCWTQSPVPRSCISDKGRNDLRPPFMGAL